MDGSHSPCGGSRRRFLKVAAASGAALASAEPLLAAPQASKAVIPTVTLGKTGQKVTKLGMGTSWALTPNFVQRALFAGIRYIDTSESYENTVSEKVLGQVLGEARDKALVLRAERPPARRRRPPSK